MALTTGNAAPIAAGKKLITAFLKPENVQQAQRTRLSAVRGASNPARSANIAAIKYERAPQQGTMVDVTDKNGNPLLPGYMPPGMRCDCFA